MSKKDDVHLTDLIPSETLQRIQDSFSRMARMAALTTDENGIPVTNGSNFSDFCTNYCRKSPVGRVRCEKCDRDGAIMALKTGKPVYYFCHAHLVDFAAPIMLGDRMIGSFIGGQVLSEEPDYDKIREIAKEIGVDEDGFVEAARKTQRVPKQAIERSTNFIFEFSQILSDMAYKSYETIRLSKLAASQKADFLANMSHEILKEYYLAIDKRASIITEALKKGDIKGYTIEVHSLKSTSRQIGAEALAELAERLEKAGNEQDTDLILAKTDDLIAEYMRYKDLIAPLFPELSGKNEVCAANGAVVSMLLDSMTEAIDSMDTLAMDDVLEKMSEYSFTSAQMQCFENLKSSVEECDIDMCMTIVGVWRQIVVSESAKDEPSAGEISSVLEEMQNALDDFDTLLIDDVLEKMEKMNFSEHHSNMFAKLKKAAENSDIDSCSLIVSNWRTSLQ